MEGETPSAALASSAATRRQPSVTCPRCLLLSFSFVLRVSSQSLNFASSRSRPGQNAPTGINSLLLTHMGVGFSDSVGVCQGSSRFGRIFSQQSAILAPNHGV